MKDILKSFVGLAIMLAILYGVYWVGKNVSYAVFYEDMVLETIKQTVKPEYLIKGN